MDEVGGIRDNVSEKDTWPSKREAARRLRVKAERERKREEPERMSALEQLQFHIYPGTIDKVAAGLEGGGFTNLESEAIQYCHRTIHKDNKTGQRASKPVQYTSYIYDGIRAVKHEVTRTVGGTAQRDQDRAVAAAKNPWLSDNNAVLSVIAPLSINRGLHFLGRTNLKHGMRPTPAPKTADLPKAHADQYFPVDHPDHPIARQIVMPGKETYLADLEGTLGDPPRHTCPEAAITKAVKRFSGNLGLSRVLDDVRWREVGAIKVNGKASSGVCLSGIGATRGKCAQSIERLAGHVVTAIQLQKLSRILVHGPLQLPNVQR